MKKGTLAERIRVVRGYYNKSQTEFAKELEISQSAMSAIELDRVIPSADILQKIGKMGFDLDWLLYGESSKKKLAETTVANTALNWEKIRINKILGSLSHEELRFCRQWLELYVKSLKKADSELIQKGDD
jgi:transcriptional regulator with XRE-family HTH domain